MYADLLVSSSRPRKSVIPSINQNSGIISLSQNLYAAGLSEKVKILRHWLCIGFAGHKSQIDKFLSDFDKKIPLNPVCHEELQEIVKGIYKEEYLERFRFILWSVYNDQNFSFSIGNYGTINTKNLLMIGGGRNDFRRIDSKFYGNLSRKDVNTTVLSLFSLGISLQWRQGFGKENAWGGGIDIIFYEYGRFVRKNNISIRTFSKDVFGNVRCHNHKLAQFRYNDQTFVAFTDNYDNGKIGAVDQIDRPFETPTISCDSLKLDLDFAIDIFTKKDNSRITIKSSSHFKGLSSYPFIEVRPESTQVVYGNELDLILRMEREIFFED